MVEIHITKGDGRFLVVVKDQATGKSVKGFVEGTVAERKVAIAALVKSVEPASAS